MPSQHPPARPRPRGQASTFGSGLSFQVHVGDGTGGSGPGRAGSGGRRGNGHTPPHWLLLSPLRSPLPLPHTHSGGSAALCQNQEQEANKELYTTKDMTSIFFQVNVSLPVGGCWRRREEERAGKGWPASPGGDSRGSQLPSCRSQAALSLGPGPSSQGPLCPRD